jgi:hypothetical protein
VARALRHQPGDLAEQLRHCLRWRRGLPARMSINLFGGSG